MIFTAWIFSRWMACVYLAAFWSLGLQVLGLIGTHGVLPVHDYLQYVQQQAHSLSRFWAVPTLCWLNSSDGFLLFLCWGGVALSLLFLLGVAPMLTAFLLWLFYLSVTIAGQDFLGFQWDNLLLEAGFLLIFLFPPAWLQFKPPSVKPSPVIIWLLRWLLFRLMFESGVVKLASGDVNWSHLTALTYHYWTQPLPNVISWYAAQLPIWFQKFSCVYLFFVELFVPFFIFAGRLGRVFAFLGIVSLQCLIFMTGNYCFFNLLAIGLCLMLLEDSDFQLRRYGILKEKGDGSRAYKMITGIIAVYIAVVSVALTINSLLQTPIPDPVKKLIVAESPLRSINNYGLFAVMTTQRNEIILEGSLDGEHWLPYEFPFKPGNVNEMPRWVAPFQPRLDWQMWFAALGDWRDNQWVLMLMEKLLKNEPSVTRLFVNNPFKDHAPKYIQASLWDYHFTTFRTKGPNGPWWRREFKGLYCPTVSLK